MRTVKRVIVCGLLFVLLVGVTVFSGGCQKRAGDSLTEETQSAAVAENLPADESTEEGKDEAPAEESSPVQEVEPEISDTEAVSEEAEVTEETQGIAGQNSVLEVHFMDVGQGASALLVCDGEAMLIDGGRDDKGTAVQLYLMKRQVQKLNYIIGTHPDADHIGGLDVAIYKFRPDTLFLSGQESDSKAYRDVLDAAEEISCPVTVPGVGDWYSLGSARFLFVGPIHEYADRNDNSLVVLLEHGQNRFLFGADAGEKAEHDMVSAGMDLDVDVYLASHHGSADSSSKEFLEAMTPEAAVISCGSNNPYGHPHAETLNLLREMGVAVYRTDEQGSISVVSDGETCVWNCAPSDTWKAGERTGAPEETDPETPPGSGMQETAGEAGPENGSESVSPQAPYIGNKRNQKLHRADCSGYLPAKRNQVLFETLEEAKEKGFTEEKQCQNCRPFDTDAAAP